MCRTVETLGRAGLRAGLLVLLGLLFPGCRFSPTAELQVGTPRSRMVQVEDQGSAAITVSIPVRASVEGAEFKLNRAGQEISFESSPSASLTGGLDLVDESASFSTLLAYQIVASFPTGEAIKKDLTLQLVRSLLSFPTLAITVKSTTPKFVWSTQGLEFATFGLEVAPESATGYSLLFGKGVSSYDWGNYASPSVGAQTIMPRPLVTGVKYTARVTATTGSAEKQEQMVSKTVTFTP